MNILSTIQVASSRRFVWSVFDLESVLLLNAQRISHSYHKHKFNWSKLAKTQPNNKSHVTQNNCEYNSISLEPLLQRTNYYYKRTWQVCVCVSVHLNTFPRVWRTRKIEYCLTHFTHNMFGPNGCEHVQWELFQQYWPTFSYVKAARKGPSWVHYKTHLYFVTSNSSVYCYR